MLLGSLENILEAEFLSAAPGAILRRLACRLQSCILTRLCGALNHESIVNNIFF